MIRELYSLFASPIIIYYASVGSEIVRNVINTLGRNTFVTLSTRLLERMQKQASKHRSIIFLLNKVFGKHFNVFNVLADMASNVVKIFAMLWVRAIHMHVFLLHSLFLLFVFLTVCLFDCCCFLFVWLSCCYCFSVIYLYLYVPVLIYVLMSWHFVL